MNGSSNLRQIIYLSPADRYIDPATLREGVLFKLSADKISGIAREIDSSKARVFLESFYDVHVGVRSRTPVSAA